MVERITEKLRFGYLLSRSTSHFVSKPYGVQLTLTGDVRKREKELLPTNVQDLLSVNLSNSPES